ncbi:MAG: hypothetical protein K2X91_04105 [Thermoleophilia bacterium]|nr:hypothetical protein [Thermoleophilia bacterium]
MAATLFPACDATARREANAAIAALDDETVRLARRWPADAELAEMRAAMQADAYAIQRTARGLR